MAAAASFSGCSKTTTHSSSTSMSSSSNRSSSSSSSSCCCCSSQNVCSNDHQKAADNNDDDDDDGSEDGDANEKETDPGKKPSVNDGNDDEQAFLEAAGPPSLYDPALVDTQSPSVLPLYSPTLSVGGTPSSEFTAVTAAAAAAAKRRSLAAAVRRRQRREAVLLKRAAAAQRQRRQQQQQQKQQHEKEKHQSHQGWVRRMRTKLDRCIASCIISLFFSGKIAIVSSTKKLGFARTHLNP